jgi:hypothetical protein
MQVAFSLEIQALNYKEPHWWILKYGLFFYSSQVKSSQVKSSQVKSQVKSSQVKLLITNKAFCIVQRATAQSKSGIFLDCGVAEAPPGFQAGWSDCYNTLSLSVHFVCSSGDNAAQTFFSLRRLNHETFREIKFTYVF